MKTRIAPKHITGLKRTNNCFRAGCFHASAPSIKKGKNSSVCITIMLNRPSISSAGKKVKIARRKMSHSRA